MLFAVLLQAIQPIRRPRGRSRKRPEKVHAGNVYDFPKCWRFLRQYGNMQGHIVRRGVDSGKRLGLYCWVVERTQAQLSRNRRHSIRYKRRADIHEASSSLEASLICLRFLEKGF